MERDEEDLVRLYLTDIGQYPLLTKDDEVRLAQQIESGTAARGEMDGSSDLTPARKRELRKQIRAGEDAERTFVQVKIKPRGWPQDVATFQHRARHTFRLLKSDFVAD